MSDASILADPVKYDRFAATRGLAKPAGDTPQVDPKGGHYGAGVIRGVSVISRGEALGHQLWVDDTTLKQVADSINATGGQGVKSRFTHPSASGDGLGSFIGRVHGPAVVADGRVIADGLHIAESAHNSPKGDLGGYIMQLAVEDPEAFGTSAMFLHDFKAENDFQASNQEEFDSKDARGRKVKAYRFRSPDPANVKNYPHVRIEKLKAVDAVDSPAANPGGLFTRGQEIPKDIDALAAYALGLTDKQPELSALDLDPGRVAAFVARFLESRNLEVRERQMADVKTETPEVTVDPRAEFAATLKRFAERFGAENGAKWAAEGKTYPEALEAHAASVEALAKAATAKAEAAEKALAAVKLGEVAPLTAPSDKKPTGLASVIRIKTN